jgi:DNA-binding CsgD family transcriptional regulator
MRERALPATQLSPLLEALYAGLMQADPWSAFLRRLAQAMDAPFATLILTGPGPTEIVTPDADPRLSRNYSEAMFAKDPFVGLPEGEVISFDDFVSSNALNAPFRHYLEDSGSGQILGVDLRTPAESEARLRITRDRSRPGFGEAERRLLAAIVPHFRIALRLFSRLQASAAEQGVYRAAIERMAMATLILDRKARLLRSNELADQLIEAGGAMRLRDGKLFIAGREAARKLTELLASPPGPDESVRFRIVPDGEQGTELVAVARGIPAPSYTADSGPALALFIVDPGRPAAVTPDALRDIFQFTRQEASLAAELAGGTALVDAARRLGIAHNTARSHLRAIFAKTGARRQSQLVHLIRASAREMDVEN